MTDHPYVSPNDLQELLDSDDEELFELLGEELLTQSHGAGPINPRAAIREAREWLNGQIATLRNRICGDPVAKDLLQGGPPNIVAIAVILDPILDRWKLALLVAAILTRSSLVQLCTA